MLAGRFKGSKFEHFHPENGSPWDYNDVPVELHDPLYAFYTASKETDFDKRPKPSFLFRDASDVHIASFDENDAVIEAFTRAFRVSPELPSGWRRLSEYQKRQET